MSSPILSGTLFLILLVAHFSFAQNNLLQGYTYTSIPTPNVQLPPMSDPPNFDGINDFGQMVGTIYNYEERTAKGAILTGDKLITFSVGSNFVASSSAINNLGHIVGSYYSSGIYTGYFWNGTTFVSLAYGNSPNTELIGINDHDLIVGYYTVQTGGFRAFSYSLADGFMDIPCPGDNNYAYGVNNSGQIVGAYETDGQTHGFMWDGTHCATLDYPGGSGTLLFGINDAGQIVGEVATADGNSTAFIYSNGQFAALNVPQASSSEAFKINNVGQIVGAWTGQAGGGGIFEANPPAFGTPGYNSEQVLTTGCCVFGTLGSLLRTFSGSYVLSNDHVLGWPVSPLTNMARSTNQVSIDQNSNLLPGQPAGCPDVGDIGTFATARFLAQIVGGFSGMDAALATSTGMPSNGRILDIGIPASTTITPTRNMDVAKRGAASNLTCGQVVYSNCTVNNTYHTCPVDHPFIVPFTGVIGILGINGGPFALKGDSGALIVDTETSQATALLFAGTDDNQIAFAIPISRVLGTFNATIVGGPSHPVTACLGNGLPQLVNTPRLPLSRADIDLAAMIKEKFEASIMADPAVQAMCTGSSDNDPTTSIISVMIEKDRPFRPIPETLEGIPTQVVRIGKLEGNAGCAVKLRKWR